MSDMFFGGVYPVVIVAPTPTSTRFRLGELTTLLIEPAAFDHSLRVRGTVIATELFSLAADMH